ncbi:RNA methyltransferase [Simkania negevensis]|uniref:RNA methyltransferase n=1 Tax=Simkania negevensis TaxID=83561 RepID=A0ABS3AQH4_9BACT|nr:RNA methyltransferase [Simkania negevensis]
MIESLQHPLVKHLVKLRNNRSYRYEKQSVVVTGDKLIADICQHQPAKTFLYSDKSSYSLHPITAQTSYRVSEAVIKKISGQKTPQSTVAEFFMPAKTSLKGKVPLLACDNIQDPGNLGTLLRTALAFNFQGVFLLNNCVDPFNDKALRSAQGASFLLPLARGSWAEFDRLVAGQDIDIYVADLKGKQLEEVEKKNKTILIMSNEASGPTEEVLQRGCQVTIPISTQIDSLNVAVAGAILMYAFNLGLRDV